MAVGARVCSRTAPFGASPVDWGTGRALPCRRPFSLHCLRWRILCDFSFAAVLVFASESRKCLNMENSSHVESAEFDSVVVTQTVLTQGGFLRKPLPLPVVRLREDLYVSTDVQHWMCKVTLATVQYAFVSPPCGVRISTDARVRNVDTFR